MHWLWTFIWENRTGVFSGIGVGFITLIFWIFRATLARLFTKPQAFAVNASAANGSIVAAGQNIQQTINNSVKLPAPTSDKRYKEWQNLIQEFPKILDEMGKAFGGKNWPRGGIIDVDGDDLKPAEAVKRGNLIIHGQLYIAEVLRGSGLIAKWEELEQGTGVGDFVRAPNEEGYSPISRFMQRKDIFLTELRRVAREDVRNT